jgi:hypothetical protein
MERIVHTHCRYGTFELFFSRLLLWRVSKEAENTADITEKGQHLPSWSWMTYSRIQFLEVSSLCVPPLAFLHFDSEQRNVLIVQTRRIQNCIPQQQGSRRIILDEDSKDVGELWFDTTANADFHCCVVIGMEEDGNGDAEKTYYILLLRGRLLDNWYERVGVGKIKARCVSAEYSETKVF